MGFRTRSPQSGSLAQNTELHSHSLYTEESNDTRNHARLQMEAVRNAAVG
jgi:hypothetical protein